MNDFILSWDADDDDQVTELARDLPDAPKGNMRSLGDLVHKRMPELGDVPSAEQLVAHAGDHKVRDPGHPRDSDLRSVSDENHKIGDHPCLKCGEEHRQELEALRAEVQKWKLRADELGIKFGLCEQHLDDVKQSRMEFRNEVTLLEAELVQVRAELEQMKKPWWKKG